MRGTDLASALSERTRRALASGALLPIETELTTVDGGGIRFVVRSVSTLERKRRAARKRAAGRRPHNPFLPYDPELFVADLSPTHVGLLNKFPVLDDHLLIVTRAFEEQDAPLGLADFEALGAALDQLGGLGFYNGGREAGASQRHKHLQLVPGPLGAAGAAIPVEAVLPDAPAGELVIASSLPFEHRLCRLARAGPAALLERYRAMRAATGPGPYNLLVTPRWMLLVARARDAWEGISVNSLGFAGSLFVRDAAQMALVERIGPLALLERVSRQSAGGHEPING